LHTGQHAFQPKRWGCWRGRLDKYHPTLCVPTVCLRRVRRNPVGSLLRNNRCYATTVATQRGRFPAGRGAV
jgi:hypothetical protein